MERQAHVRAERGTRCYLEKRCEKMSSYDYDADIAEAVRRAFAGSPLLKGTSLWVTVQRRWVFIEGCAPPNRKQALDARARRIPNVDNVFVDLLADPGKTPPYYVVPASR